ncbi:lipoprotein [Bacillus testis]|uniref:lipoprotein n=1 Tax=Bacillus testis TaxID=1622072 RepID=UPI00067F7387|nr:lipoprotein [Bacillus testis]
MRKMLYLFLFLLLLSGCQESNSNIKEESLEETKTDDYKEKNMFTIDAYLQDIEDVLELNSKNLIDKLKEIDNLTFYSEVELLDFSTFVDPTHYTLSIVMFSMDKEANEVFYEGNDSNLFSGSMNIIDNIKYYQISDNQMNLFSTFYEENAETIVPKEQEVIKDWFEDCWITANNGQESGLPSYFSFHDEYKSYDLINKKWISEDEMWSF